MIQPFKRSVAVLSALVLSLSCLTASAKKPDNHPGQGNGNGKPDREQRDQDSRNEGREDAPLLAPLSERERDEIARLMLGDELEQARSNPGVSGEGRSLPPGLQKKLERGGSLPPGWQKKLQRGEVIDRETYRDAERIPDELLRRVTGREDAVELLQVGDRILRVAEGRGTILDVIDLTDRATRLMLGQ